MGLAREMARFREAMRHRVGGGPTGAVELVLAILRKHSKIVSCARLHWFHSLTDRKDRMKKFGIVGAVAVGTTCAIAVVMR